MSEWCTELVQLLRVRRSCLCACVGCCRSHAGSEYCASHADTSILTGRRTMRAVCVLGHGRGVAGYYALQPWPPLAK